jgi:polysaccharide pyruvyl transferase WcaK-like protein
MHRYFEIKKSTIITPGYYIRKKRIDEIHRLRISNEEFEISRRFYWLPEIIISSILIKLFRGRFGFGKFYRDLKKVDFVFNISGGDGFTDIYSNKTFIALFWPSLIGALLNKKLILLPQTIGPFNKVKNQNLAEYAIKKATKVYVRDLVYADRLKKLEVPYIETNDVSFYMEPQKVDIEIDSNAIGINISGLAYYNNYKDLKGRFPYYKNLLIKIIELFQNRNIPVFLVPHTYNHETPEINADDLQASKDIYESLTNKKGINIIASPNTDYIAPELKYIISKFDYFIGTRLHADFAAIYTNVPVFGLAYSYKFSGSFNRYGLNEHYSSVVDLKKEDIQEIVNKIEKSYLERQQTKNEMIVRSKTYSYLGKI